jgi:hypothetical protein
MYRPEKDNSMLENVTGSLRKIHNEEMYDQHLTN